MFQVYVNFMMSGCELVIGQPMPLLVMLHLHKLKYAMINLSTCQVCYVVVAVLHLLELLQHSNLSSWFPLVHKPYVYDALMLFAP